RTRRLARHAPEAQSLPCSYVPFVGFMRSSSPFFIYPLHRERNHPARTRKESYASGHVSPMRVATHRVRCMRAVTFQAPGEVRLEEVPEPSVSDVGDAIVRVEATGLCGSDLHIYHGRVVVEPGFVIGHEYVGTIVEVGDGVRGLAAGDRVLGAFLTACGGCFHCRRGEFHKCDAGRVFGHGATLGSLAGSQAELL